MTRPIASPFVRAAVVVLVLAVVLCVALPMSDDGTAGMDFALLCCFMLAAALVVFILQRRQPTTPLGDVSGLTVPLARRPTRTARAPDIVALGALLI